MVNNTSSSLLTKTQLTKFRIKAIRAGVWFRAIPRIDRVLVDLTIKVADNIRSAQLAKSIFAILSKLEPSIEGKFHRLAKTVGRPLAEKTSQIAQNWGNLSARRWSTDWSFALYLAVLQANK